MRTALSAGFLRDQFSPCAQPLATKESRKKAKAQGMGALCSFEHRDAIGISSGKGASAMGRSFGHWIWRSLILPLSWPTSPLNLEHLALRFMLVVACDCQPAKKFPVISVQKHAKNATGEKKQLHDRLESQPLCPTHPNPAILFASTSPIGLAGPALYKSEPDGPGHWLPPGTTVLCWPEFA